MSELLKTRIYRPCEEKCGRCKVCRDFAQVIGQIDLRARSESERQREAQVELRKGER